MDKLPADLPENWTQGQTISPNGTEVGLTEQHGYNYLNKQVNAVQRAVNDIHTELDGVAKETTLTKIDAKIGESEDTSTHPTIFGKLAEIKQIILEKASEIISAITGFVDKIGNPEDSSSTDTIFGKLQNIGYIKGSDKVFYETIFQAGAKTLNVLKNSSALSGKIVSVCADSSYIYCASQQSKLYKLNVSNLEKISEVSVPIGLYNLILDGSYIYAKGGDQKVYKISTSTMSVVATSAASYGGYSGYMTIDTSYIYVVPYSQKAIYKLNKSDLAQVGKFSDSSVSSDIRYLNAESSYLFAVYSNVIFKINKSDMTKITSAGTSDDAYYIFYYNSKVYVLAGGSSNSFIKTFDINLSNQSNNISIQNVSKDYLWEHHQNRINNWIYLLNPSKKPIKINLSDMTEYYIAEGSAKACDTNSAPRVISTNIIYPSGTTNSQIVKMSTTPQGMSTIKGYQEVID